MKIPKTFALSEQKSKDIRQIRFENWVIQITLIMIGLFTVEDIFSDLGEGAPVGHVAAEVVAATLSFLAVWLLWKRNSALQIELAEQKELRDQAEADRSAALVEAQQWRQEASRSLQGLSEAIDTQLDRWSLTPAEKEVALLLLKGLSLKEIATVRGVSEKTARAQSFSVYAKSGLSGRAELSAFFLEDLMLPQVSPQELHTEITP